MVGKEDWVIGAIYRLFSRRKINNERAAELLNARASINKKAAKQTVEIWSRYAPLS
jgi:hypothetical protein